MASFSSKRERRLWLCALAVVVAIASTLGLAQTLAGVIQDERLLGAAFALGMLLVVATITTQGLSVRPGGRKLGVVLGVTAAIFLVFVRVATPADRTHLIEYGLLAVFMYEALVERAHRGRRVPAPAALAILGAVLVGACDEGLQAFIPGRVFDPLDLVFNTLAAVTSVVATALLRRVFRGRRQQDTT